MDVIACGAEQERSASLAHPFAPSKRKSVAGIRAPNVVSRRRQGKS
jgi:hypothetical protein